LNEIIQLNSFTFEIKLIGTMKLKITSIALFFSVLVVQAQTNPAITSWLQNNTITGRHYVNGNSIPIVDAVIANVQTVQYSTDWVYANTNGIPTYVTGPFLDGNPSLATDQNAIFKFPLNPVQNTGTPTATTGGNIGVFINGVALFDYRDGVAWNSTTSALCGGPGNPPCPGGPGANMDWNRDAVPAERPGFDCSKAHPAMGNYHHHQNPSAFNLDLVTISNICDLYPADGLYAIDSTVHSPLIGFAYDGFPIYGAYGYKNADGTGGITRIKSSYTLRNITTRTTSPTGAIVTTGPIVSATYPLGYFREDYQYNATSTNTPDFLDEHNGRFCVTPEYPNGIYCYFATVDGNWNSAYPYVVGPTFYGVKTAAKVTSITETVSTFTSTTGLKQSLIEQMEMSVFPNPASEFIAVQLNILSQQNINIGLYDMLGNLVQHALLYQGSTITYFDTRTLYSGQYVIKVLSPVASLSKTVTINK
jgi:hypothetical protein